jgi:hypothetical protein
VAIRKQREGQSELLQTVKLPMISCMTDETIKEKFEEIAEASEIYVEKVDTLRKDVNSLKEDVHQLVELVWCLVHTVQNQRLIHGIDTRHAQMCLDLAEKHGVVSAGKQD